MTVRANSYLKAIIGIKNETPYNTGTEKKPENVLKDRQTKLLLKSPQS